MHGKKEWNKPELIVVLRSNPEEAVMGTCKGWESDVAPGPNVDFSCNVPPGSNPCNERRNT
jgi:hypothetical protein